MNKSIIVTDSIQNNEQISLVSLLDDSYDNLNISADDQSSWSSNLTQQKVHIDSIKYNCNNWFSNLKYCLHEDFKTFNLLIFTIPNSWQQVWGQLIIYDYNIVLYLMVLQPKLQNRRAQNNFVRAAKLTHLI